MEIEHNPVRRNAFVFWDWVDHIYKILTILSIAYKVFGRIRRDADLRHVAKDAAILGIVSGVAFLLATSVPLSTAMPPGAASPLPITSYATHSTETLVARSAIFGVSNPGLNLLDLTYVVILMILMLPAVGVVSKYLEAIIRLAQSWKMGEHVASTAPNEPF